MDKAMRNIKDREYANGYCADAMAEMGADEMMIRIDGDLHDPKLGNVGDTFRIRNWNGVVVWQSVKCKRFVSTMSDIPLSTVRKATQRIQHALCGHRGVPTEKLDWAYN